MGEISDKERREYKRYKIQSPVRFKANEPNKIGAGVSIDLSEGGIRLNINEFLPVKTELLLQIQLELSKFIECTGKVVWVEKFPFSDRYQAGVQFDHSTITNSREMIKKALRI